MTPNHPIEWKWNGNDLGVAHYAVKLSCHPFDASLDKLDQQSQLS